MKLLIADDHPIVRNGIKEIILDFSPDCTIDEAEDAHQIVKKVITNDYDLIILDISMPGGGGLNALKQIKQAQSDTKVIMLSMYCDEQYINRSLKAGASGYLTKSVASEELEVAIRKVLSGEKYLSSEVASKMASFIYSDKEREKHELLSEREFQVFKLIVNGYKTSEIAKELHLSAKTVSTYRSRIMIKMDMSRNSELIHYAINNKLID
jgi:DNA-binding NarL/FixJ family response regulator